MKRTAAARSAAAAFLAMIVAAFGLASGPPSGTLWYVAFGDLLTALRSPHAAGLASGPPSGTLWYVAFGGLVTALRSPHAIPSAQVQEELGLLGQYEDAKRITQDKEDTNQFVFARLIFNGRIPGYIKNWYTDYPDADNHLMWALRRMSNLDVAEHGRVVAITDPALFRYPLIYTSEPGQMVLTDDDARILREYLERGGFWMLDDFWGSFEWGNMTAEMKKILPDAEIRDIPINHPIFHEFFDVDKLKQVPSLAYVYNGGITYEQDGFEAECKGIWDKDGRLVVVINHNTDLGDAYEHMDKPEYPYEFSSYAYRVAVNTFLYALTH